MSSKVVPKILEELYEVQPSLRERESELITIIKAIQEQQQTLAIDSTFRETLRLKLLEEAKNITVKQKPYSIHWSGFFAFASTICVSLFIGIVAWNTFFSITPLSQRDPQDRAISVSESVSDGTNMMKSRMMLAPQADLSPSLPNDACPVENYRNHESTESMITPYREYSTGGIQYMALPGYDSLVAIMKPTDPISHSDGTFLILYEDTPIKETPRNTIQNIIDTQITSASLLQKNPLPLSKDPCIVEAYTGSDDCHPGLTRKAGYQYYRIRSQSPESRGKGEYLICGQVTQGPSEPYQYYIYSEKTGKILYVNTTQDPYPFDPTSLEF